MLPSGKKNTNGFLPAAMKKKSKKKSASSSAETEITQAIPKCSTPEAVALPRDILPFSHDVITPEVEVYARTHLNETPETRVRALNELRDILKSDPDLVTTDRDDILLVFLRSKKFDVKRAAEFIKTGLSYLENYRHLLERKDPEIVRRVISKHMIGFMSYRDPDGRVIIYARADAWNPEEIPAGDCIFAGIMAVQSAGLNPLNQIMGFIVVLDLKDLTFQQTIAMSRWMIFGTITLQRACPCFMKAFHIINMPPIFKLAWKIVKPLLSEKIRKRFVIHKSSDLSSLHAYLPKEILPPELGGSVPFNNEHWAKNIDQIEKEYYSNLRANYVISRRKQEASQT